MAEGQLHVTIIEAAKLADRDKSDFNDPYVEVYLDEKDRQKTSTIQNEERPVWNQTFDFDLLTSNKYLYIDVYDADEGEESDFIGSAKISLDDVIKKGHFDDWVKLTGLLGFGRRGDVHIRMTYEKT